MKCVAQTPKPVEIAETASQARRIWALDLRTWWSRLMAVNEANVHITAAKPTSRKSCCVTIQLNTAYIWSSSRIETDSYGGISTYISVIKSAAFGPREFESNTKSLGPGGFPNRPCRYTRRNRPGHADGRAG